MSNDPTIILYTALSFSLLSFFCSIYSSLRILLPLLARKKANSISRSPDSISPPQDENLKSAQRFTAWLAGVDVIAACILVWEAAMVMNEENGLGSSGASRIFFCTTARPTLLLVVASLSYINVVKGRSISLGSFDWIVWLPTSILLILGTGFASLSVGNSVFIGLLIWCSTITTIVVFCFGRLLIAILRVRKATFIENQNYKNQFTSTNNQHSNTFLPSIRNNFSGISASFISTIGRNTRSNYHFSGERLYDPEDPFANSLPTPITPQTSFNRPMNSTPDHLTLSFEELPRPSVGSYNTIQTYSNPMIQLSQKEARSALIRLGGHLISALLGYALVLPFLVLQIMNPHISPPLFSSILLIIGICQPGIILSIQTATSEGFWFKSEPLVTISSNIATNPSVIVESQERPSITSYRSNKIDTRNFDEEPKGKIARALSMVQTHPKLLILPTQTVATSTSYTARKNSSSSGHSRLRSLNLGKGTSTTSLVSSLSLNRSDQRHRTSASLNQIQAPTTTTRVQKVSSRISSSSLPSHDQIRTVQNQIPFGFNKKVNQNSIHSLPPVTSTPSPLPTTKTDLKSRTRPVSLPASPQSEPSKPSSLSSSTVKDYRIDFLSSKLLPTLVPSVKIGDNTRIESENRPLNYRRSSLGNLPCSKSTPDVNISNQSFASKISSKNKNYRNLSLPGILRSRPTLESDSWIEIEIEREMDLDNVELIDGDDNENNEEEGLFAEVDKGRKEEKLARRKSWKEKASKAWSELEKVNLSNFKLSKQEGVSSQIIGEGNNFEDESTLEEEENLESQIYLFPTINEMSQNPTSNLPSTLPLNFRRKLRYRDTTEEEDAEVGSILCATFRPISRNSIISTTSQATSSSSRNSFSSTDQSNSDSHTPRHSRRYSSLTSRGFQNLLESGTWHANNSICSSDLETSSSEAEQQEFDSPRRSSNARRTSSLLGERDINLHHYDDSSSSDIENRSISKPLKSARDSEIKNSSPFTTKLPTTIKEDQEDQRSGSPTPKATRYRPRYKSRTISIEETTATYLSELGTTTSTAQTIVNSTSTSSTSQQLTGITPTARYKPRANVEIRRSVRNVMGDPEKKDSPRTSLMKMR